MLGLPLAVFGFVVFVAVMLAVLIPYWFLVVRDEQAVLDRLNPRKGGKGSKRLNVLKAEDALSWLATTETGGLFFPACGSNTRTFW